MRLWRISDFADLSGQGGLLQPARWHSVARQIVYLADHPASALLEVLIHLEVDGADFPSNYQLLAVDVPDDVAFETAPELAGNWRSNANVTQETGNRWLARGGSALLQVPSAIVPHAWNWLLNPVHSESGRAQIAQIVQAEFDPRLFD